MTAENILAKTKSNITTRSHHNVTVPRAQSINLSSTNFLHLTVSEIEPGADFKTQGHYGKVTVRIKVTPWMHTYTSHQCPSKYQLPTPSEIQPGHDYCSHHPPACPTRHHG